MDKNRHSNSLKSFELRMEDPYPKKYITPHAGDGLKVSIFRRLFNKIIWFLLDVWAATKSIFEEIN